MAIGGAIGGAVDPTKINGPKIGDGQQQAATDGNPIAWIQGTAMVAGTLVQVSKRRQIRHKDGGKGSGTVQVTFTASQDFCILICESCELRDSTMSSVLMVLQDGKLVYDVRPGSTMLFASYKWKQGVDFRFGAENQLPHPTLEAITGVGNTPAYRGSLTAIFKNFNVTPMGDRIPSYQFVVASSSVSQEEELLPVMAVTTPGFHGPLTYEVGAQIDDIAIPDVGSLGIYIDALYGGPLSRFRIVPLYGVVTPSSEVLSGPGVAEAISRVAFWDSGWLSWPDAYVMGPDVSDAFEAAGLGAPTPSLLTSFPLPVFVPVPAGASGIRVFSFGYYDGFNDAAHIVGFDWADTSSLSRPVEPVYGGYVISSGVVYRPPWRPALPRAGSQPAPLSQIISRICLRGGLSAADFDVTALTATAVLGYPIARQANAADALLPLMQAYFGYGSEYDAKLRFKFYGEDADVTLDAQDLLESGSEEGAIKSNLRNQETEFPRRVVASYMDPAQNYSVVNVAAERLSIDVTAIGDQAFQIPVVMDADTAARAADRAMKVAYASLQGKLEFSTPFAGADSYISLAAGEPALLNGKRYVVDEMILGNGVIKFTQRYDRQSAYTSNVQATVGNSPSTPPSPYSGPTTLIPMNLPSLRPQDTYGAYLAAAGTDAQSNWAGCTVQVSYDDQQSWVSGTTISAPSVFGVLTLAEPVGGEPLTAQMNGQLESVTDAQILARANAFALLHASGTEIGQFKTATETATDDEYELTDVTRGGLGTTRVAGITGGQIVMLEDVTFLPIDLSFAGKTIYFRAVGFNEQAEDAVVVPFVYTPDLTVVINGGEVT